MLENPKIGMKAKIVASETEWPYYSLSVGDEVEITRVCEPDYCTVKPSIPTPNSLKLYGVYTRELELLDA